MGGGRVSSKTLAASHGRNVKRLIRDGADVERVYLRAKLAAHYGREVLNGVS